MGFQSKWGLRLVFQKEVISKNFQKNKINSHHLTKFHHKNKGKERKKKKPQGPNGIRMCHYRKCQNFGVNRKDPPNNLKP